MDFAQCLNFQQKINNFAGLFAVQAVIEVYNARKLADGQDFSVIGQLVNYFVKGRAFNEF